MSSAGRTTLLVAFVVTAFVLFLFGDGFPPWMEASAATSGGTSPAAIHWMWVSASLAVVLGVAFLSAALRWK